MKTFKQGTPAFGIFLGILFVAMGALLMTIGFWKTLLLSLLFLVGYFCGAVNNKEQFVKDTVNRVIPEKKEKTIDLKESLTRKPTENGHPGEGSEHAQTDAPGSVKDGE